MMVVDHINDNLDDYGLEYALVYGDTCVTWFAIVGKSWRALIISDGPDGVKEKFFFIFYDSTDGRTYFDVYTKTDSMNFNNRTYGMGAPAETTQPVDPQPAA